MVTQEKLVQQESVIKVAKPIDEHLNNDKFDHHLKQLRGQWLLPCYMFDHHLKQLRGQWLLPCYMFCLLYTSDAADE